MQCPSFESLLHYAAGAEEAVDNEMIDRHIAAGCEICRERLAFCRDAALALREPLDNGPDSLINHASTLFQRSSYMAAPTDTIIFASVIFDSLSRTSALGARSSAPAVYSRRLLYRANIDFDKSIESTIAGRCFDVDISIKRTPETANFVVRGQILIENNKSIFNSRVNISLYRGGINPTSAHTNELGEFSFRDVSEGNYNLQIKSGKWTVVLDLPVTLSTIVSL